MKVRDGKVCLLIELTGGSSEGFLFSDDFTLTASN